jgi:hypothetical protein
MRALTNRRNIATACEHTQAALHPVAACHVTATLCSAIADVLLRWAVPSTEGRGLETGADAVHNSILCLRVLDVTSAILKEVLLKDTARTCMHATWLLI